MLELQCSNQICVLSSLSIEAIDLALLHPFDLFANLLKFKLISGCIVFIHVLTIILFLLNSLFSLSIQLSLSVFVEFD